MNNTLNPSNSSAPGKKKILFIVLAVILLLALFAASQLLFNKKQESSSVYGTYKIHSNDAEVNKFTFAEDIYLKINKDQTIIYHTTINGKPKFNITGVFTLDEKNNTLSIQWNEGKLPAQLKVEEQGGNMLIKIGSTAYIKEKK